jgi:DNA-binding IclR family transcriptional regulator
MLSTFDDAHVRALYAEWEISAPTQRSITDLDRLVNELAATRARGWARNRAEMQAGVCSVGVAIVHPTYGVLGGFSIATPQARSTRALEKTHAELLRRAAMRLLATLA